ncbi:MAG: methyltransferase domain-containing protein [Acidobacteria bacterium]|nr:MAG: methyltransferase domain-containing protein [Acidobacteriota bacterium]
MNLKRFFTSALATNSQRILEARLSSGRFRALLEAEDMQRAYADIVADDQMSPVRRSFVAARLQFIDDVLGPAEIARSTFVDVGDSDGIFLRALGKRGIGLNYTDGSTRYLMERGVTAVRGDAVRLPIADDGCDYTFCFETLEHLPSPMLALNELARVSRKGVFVSVPGVSQTTVHRAGYLDRPQPLLHVFELSDAHWRAVFTHTPLTVARAETADVVDAGRSLHERIASALWRWRYGPDVYCGTFRKFQLYYLTKS